MGRKGRPIYHVVQFRVRRSLWSFVLRYSVLLGAVLLGAVILAWTGHNEYEALLGVGGMARALELAGEAAADAFDE